MSSKKNALIKSLSKHPIQAVYLFGSQQDKGLAYIRGDNFEVDRLSDLDIGILLNKSPSSMFKLHGNLYVLLSDIFQPFNIDIIYLHEVDALLQFEIISGQRIFSANEEQLDDYEELVMKKAADLNFISKRYQKEFYEAIADGYSEIE